MRLPPPANCRDHLDTSGISVFGTRGVIVETFKWTRAVPEKNSERSIKLVTLVGEIVAAYVSNNSVPPAALPELMASVHGTLAALTGAPHAEAIPAVEQPTPAQIRKSVTPGGLVSFLDGKTYKTLKRHLTSHGLDPHSYRQRYRLPADYPMVASDYAAQRSALAKSIGLGQLGDRSEEPQPNAKGRGSKAA